MKTQTSMHPAIAMIELIFALVIMGIALMSAPMLISTATKSTSVALQQEGINEAMSRVSMILTYDWDENDVNDSCIPPVLHVVSGDSELDEVGTTARRVGVPINTNSHTFKCEDSEFNASPIGLEGSIKNDIDDFIGTDNLVDASGTGSTSGIDYIERTSVSVNTAVSYIADTGSYNSTTLTYTPGATSTTTTNIKLITVTLTSTRTDVPELNKTIVLKAFSCNIGGYQYESKEI